MLGPEDIAATIADSVEALPKGQGRRLIAVAGPPASGKTTVAAVLRDTLNARGVATGLVAMDGFHLDNSILDARGLRSRKGAPETFDLAGFAALMRRLQNEGEVIAPAFDRERDVSVGSCTVVSEDMKTVVVEGNYLLLDEPGWRDLKELWTFSAFLGPDTEVLEQRLMERWLSYGFDEQSAREKAEKNDLPNALRIVRNSLAADIAPAL